jgi:hypothetical protein
MPIKQRNYIREAQSRDLRLKRLEVTISPEEAEAFKEQLKKDGTNFMVWARKQIQEYMSHAEN